MPDSNQAAACAHSNIALIKYWGKRTSLSDGNLPAVGSLSVTLGGLSTWTSVHFDESLRSDEWVMNGKEAPEKDQTRGSRFLDLVRSMAHKTTYARVKTRNDFPTGAGLASSASGFASLALAATRAAGMKLEDRELSTLARKGSGSAARSIFGGFVELDRGESSSGDDCYARCLAPPSHWPLKVVVGIISTERKSIGSTEGMELCASTSPYYPAWIDSHPTDLLEARHAVLSRDFDQLATITEFSCLKMHAVMMASKPGLIYLHPPTLQCMHEVRRLRAQGVPACFTVDAGPQIKVVCEAHVEAQVVDALSSVPGVGSTIVSGLGGGASLVGVDSESLGHS